MTWADKQSFKALQDNLFDLYMYQQEAEMLSFIEITFCEFGHPVLYCEPHNLAMRKKVDYPSYLVKSYQEFAQDPKDISEDKKSKSQIFGPQATQEELFRRLKYLNTANKHG